MSYTLDVLINGRSVVKYPWDEYVFLEGREGTEYTIRFRNNSAYRVIAVISVDGLSIMDGEEADLDGMGYVVDAMSTLDIPGWRLDNEDVAAFKFGKRGQAYADKVGSGENVGVIGCAVFRESNPFDFRITSSPFTGPISDLPSKVTFTEDYGRQWTGDSTGQCTWTTCDSNMVTCDCSSSPTVSSVNSGVLRSVYSSSTSVGTVDPSPQHIGTEFGKRQAHAVTEVSVQREDKPTTILQLHYDSRKGLEQRGIKLGKKRRQVARAFKDARGIGCKPPRGWRGHPSY